MSNSLTFLSFYLYSLKTVPATHTTIATHTRVLTCNKAHKIPLIKKKTLKKITAIIRPLSLASHSPAQCISSNNICRLGGFGPDGLDSSLVLLGQTHVGSSVCDYLDQMLNCFQPGFKFSWPRCHTHNLQCQDSYRATLAGLIESQVAWCQVKGSLSAALLLGTSKKTRSSFENPAPCSNVQVLRRCAVNWGQTRLGDIINPGTEYKMTEYTSPSTKTGEVYYYYFNENLNKKGKLLNREQFLITSYSYSWRHKIVSYFINIIILSVHFVQFAF